jgi:hypothetical protein
MPEPQRGPWLTFCAVCFGLLALSNFLKPLHLGGQTFIFFGSPLWGVANAIIAPLFGIFLTIYTYGIWTMRRFALGMGHAYAVYVILNGAIFRMNDPDTSMGHALGGVVSALIGVGVAVGAAIVLTRRKAELR